MIRSFFRTIMLVSSILAITVGTLVLTVRLRLLDFNTFRLALAPSGIYQQMRYTIEDEFVTITAGEAAVGTVIAEEVLVELDFRSKVLEASEKNLVNFFSWLNKSNNDLLISFPRTKVVAELEDPELASKITAKLPDLISKLPDCTDELKSKIVKIPICKDSSNPNFATTTESAVKNYIATFKPANDLIDKMLVDSDLPKLPDEIRLAGLESELEKAQRDNLIGSLDTIRNLANSSALLGITFLATGVILLMAIVFIGELDWRNVIITISTVCLSAGILLTLCNLAALLFPELLIENIPEYFLLNENMQGSLKDAALLYHRNLINISFQISLYTGAVLTLISFLLLVTGKLLPKTSQELRLSESIGEGLPVDNDLAPKLVDIPFK